ncbi:MAG: putative GH43/DUF377 family glycosyl hydrolase [Flavobacteriaceae bacterium]|jgi:predicted GH43/DUF377 family glycosyl hydrolase
MKWRKLGQIFEVNQDHPQLISHASNPLALYLKNNIFRVFFSARNIENKSSVSYVDIDLEKLKVTKTTEKPLIEYGNENSFFSHGISIGNIYESPTKKKYILFMGWQIHGKEHWRGDIGRLELSKNKILKVNPNKPFMGIDEEDRISLSYPFVIFHERKYKMWYGSTIDWSSENGEMVHVIKYATSEDAINWKKHGLAIPYEIGVAQAFSRPSVIIDNNGYHMWFSYRDGTGEKYRIGYSHSNDGINWKNKLDKVGIDVSNSGWDSEMICYPFVFNYKDRRYMLYNGNNYGATGFGLAILRK